MIKINNCFDSHLHWQGIGSFKSRLDLSKIKSVAEISSLRITSENFRQNILLGHGWSKEVFLSELKSPLQILDHLFPNTPVYFTSKDIHSVWLNTKTIELLALKNKTWAEKYREYTGVQNNQWDGIFYEKAKESIDKKIPSYSPEQTKGHLLLAQKILHQAGITHIRDMTCSNDQWKMALQLEEQQQLKLVVDLYFKLIEFSELDNLIDQVKTYKSVPSELLNVRGIKVFVDGALGSAGALLTEPYLDGKQGFTLYTVGELEHILTRAFASDLEVAIHTIGDQASLMICELVTGLKNININGKIHLEHTQLLADRTIELMKGLDVTCHLQPQHWRSDRLWLDKRISKKLITKQFRWADLESHRIPFYFGSDAPVEDLSIVDVITSVEESEKHNIQALQNKISNYITYPGESSVDACTTLLDGKVHKVIFNGEEVYKQAQS